MAEPYVYALIRLVPRVERNEALNLGVVLFCRSQTFLDGRYWRDPTRWHAFAATVDVEHVLRQIAIQEAVAAGDPASGGAIASLIPQERFGWLAAPASTIVQPGPIHAGVTTDPAATLDRLFSSLVMPLGRETDEASQPALVVPV